jgi:L-alanine-DL-glutamate epimerase-like enolase superfamily enzyme
MSLYDAVAELPLVIDGYSLEYRERTAAGDFARVSVLTGIQDAAPSEPGFTRPCTRISLHGEGVTGVGEDVTYDCKDHLALVNSSDELPLAGTYTVASFSEALDEIDLFPTGDPDGEASRAYRRWGVESGALDLALQQADTDLATALGRDYDPVRFLVSTRLGDPPSANRVTQWLDLNPELEFKLDATSAWTGDLIETLAATDAVRIIDLKGQYTGTMVDQAADPVLYRRIIDAFPEALIEDPILTDETRSLFVGHEHHIAWDAPITDLASIRDLPFPPDWLNIKPSRCGRIETVLDVIDHCLDNGIRMYGGGQTELSVGREHIHALASLFYPNAPNDTAPRRYNDPEPVAGLPTSPLAPPATAYGFEWSPREGVLPLHSVQN